LIARAIETSCYTRGGIFLPSFSFSAAGWKHYRAGFKGTVNMLANDSNFSQILWFNRMEIPVHS
jgi:hypothetical protein